MSVSQSVSQKQSEIVKSNDEIDGDGDVDNFDDDNFNDDNFDDDNCEDDNCDGDIYGDNFNDANCDDDNCDDDDDGGDYAPGAPAAVAEEHQLRLA